MTVWILALGLITLVAVYFIGGSYINKGDNTAR
jgi:hypothetical protein